MIVLPEGINEQFDRLLDLPLLLGEIDRVLQINEWPEAIFALNHVCSGSHLSRGVRINKVILHRIRCPEGVEKELSKEAWVDADIRMARLEMSQCFIE
jgi:hypothetical protein